MKKEKRELIVNLSKLLLYILGCIGLVAFAIFAIGGI